MFPGFILPDPQKPSELEEAVRAQLKIILAEREQEQSKYVLIDSVLFHDPQWRTRLMSIQAAADAQAGKQINFWTVIAILFGVAQLSFALGAFGELLILVLARGSQ